MLLLGVACAQPPRTSDSWGDWVLPGTPVSTTVNAYFHHRKLALVARDPEILWARFPDLRSGEDLATGINTEGWLAAHSDTARDIVDVVYELDRYARIQMRTLDPGLVVRVHGLERYVQRDFTDGTAGEFVLDLHLKRDGAGWTVVKTDHMTLSEHHDPARKE